jgi:hypothetical protein
MQRFAALTLSCAVLAFAAVVALHPAPPLFMA